jgi:serine phosphatase RsbU (regulator of sigma subunit)
LTLRKTTRVWIAVFVASLLTTNALAQFAPESDLWRLLAGTCLALATCILLWRAGRALFRLIVRRLALRLAVSYFLIGVVPIPLLAAILALAGYVVANGYVATRLRREITAVGEAAQRSAGKLPEITVGANGLVSASEVAWLPVGSAVSWAGELVRPGFLVHEDDVWLAVRAGKGGPIRLLELNEPGAPWLQQLADRTGYEVDAEVGTSRQDGANFTVDTEPQEKGLRVGKKKLRSDENSHRRRPMAEAVPATGGIWGSGWLHAFYLETALNAVEEKAGSGKNVAVLSAVASPQIIFGQLFTQGVDEISNVIKIVFIVLTGIVLTVYAVALTIAFVLVGSIARNVNRMSRAARAISGGDFSVRVNSKSPDQIGDLARSFDGMAASIERLLVDTARKERLEGEIAIARTIQQKLLPAPEARLEGVSLLAHFAPMAEIGGDYYDHLPMPDGRLAFALGDVSGHGLPTGLLVAMAKAGLSALVEAGHAGGELFARLNELIHRSTDPRHYMTLAVLAYDPRTRQGVLTNAGQLAPYRVSGSKVEALSLPSFPLGLFPGKAFPSRAETFAAGDLVVFLSDGLIEAVNADEDAFGFDRFEAVLRSNASAGAAAVRQALLAAVDTHSGSRPPDDDRTLLILTLD